MKVRYEKIPFSKIDVDIRYQRNVDEKRVQVMAKNYDPSRIGVLVVAPRPHGRFVVIDGQHRRAAAALAGHNNVATLCEVHEGLSETQEAEMFLLLNEGRKPVKIWDKYRARLIAGHRVAVEMTEIVKSVGLSITSSSRRNGVAAIKAVEFAYHKNNLKDVLLILKKAWPSDPAGLDGELIKAVSNFVVDFGVQDAEIDHDRLTEKLSRKAPTRVKALIDANVQAGLKRRYAGLIVLRELYNTGMRAPSGRLPMPAVA